MCEANDLSIVSSCNKSESVNVTSVTLAKVMLLR